MTVTAYVYPGANPTTSRYNPSVVEIYSATNKKKIFFSDAVAYYNAGVAAVN
jgi:hypothetical protein